MNSIKLKLKFQFIDNVLNILRGRGARSILTGSASTLRLVNFQIDTSVVAHAHNTEQCADGFGGTATAADDLTHIFWVHFESKQYSHLINLAIYLDIVRVINDRAH